MNSNELKKMDTNEEETYSFKAMLAGWKIKILAVLKNWKALGLAGFVGAVIFVVYAFFQPITYTARATFVVDDSKAGGGSLASALAGQIGLDIGGVAGGNSIFAGDNVLGLLKSHSLIKKSLLSFYDSATNTTLADQYATVYGFKENWKASSKVGKDIHFAVKPLTRLEDSLLQTIINRLDEKEISIFKPDKKQGIFELDIVSRDELFSQLFCNKLIATATKFYIDTKTATLTTSINRLQKRADSLGILLNRKTYSAAEANAQTLDMNLAYAAPVVSAEISSRDKYMQATVYAEIVKNLELSKTSLAQETPTVQMLDLPEFPLKKNKLSKSSYAIAGFLFGFVLMALLLIYQPNKSKID
jgi:predicted transcriptional regulator